MLGELNAAQIERVLHGELIGRLGCHAEGRTYVVPITYVYDGTAIYGHSADGLKLRMMRQNPQVCFEVDHMDNLSNWQSVIAWGRFEELRGADAERGMKLLIERVAPILASESATPSHGSRPSGHAVIYRVVLSEKTGRFEKR